MIGCLHHTVKEFCFFLRIKLLGSLKQDCSEVNSEFGVMVDIKEAIEL